MNMSELEDVQHIVERKDKVNEDTITDIFLDGVEGTEYSHISVFDVQVPPNLPEEEGDSVPVDLILEESRRPLPCFIKATQAEAADGIWYNIIIGLEELPDLV